MNTTIAKPVTIAKRVSLFFGDYLSDILMWSTNSSGVVSVNTQARRLGCLVYIIGLISRGRKLESLLSLSTSEAASLKYNITANGFTSGHLTTAPSSVRHYVEAALAFHLIVQQGAVLDLSVRGRFLLDAIKPESGQPYPLAAAAKVFFLNTLLTFDYFGTAAIVRSLHKGTSKMSEMQREHQSELLRLLEEAFRTTTNPRLQYSVRDKLISIRNWNKPESYCEHMVSAKLNWLADLGILEPPHSSTSGFSVVNCHQEWLEDWATAAEPTEAHLLALLLRYAQFVVPKVEGQTDERFCSALNLAFHRLAPPGKLAKIRMFDFVLFIVCFQPHALIRFIGQSKGFFPSTVVDCGGIVYRAHSASRSTQSYIVREEIG